VTNTNSGVYLRRVFVDYYTPTGHGLTITVEGIKSHTLPAPKELYVNIFGDIWQVVIPARES
jgi:hypothetical protein